MEKRDRLIISDKLLSSQTDMSNEIQYSDTQLSKTVKTTPTRPSRPAKLQRPPGPPPRPKGAPPQLPPGGVQLTRSGRRHPGLRVQARLDKTNNYSFPTLEKVWRGRRIL